MDGVFYEDWEEWASVADWLYVHHPNLWGNVTTGKNNISRTSHKSIYDPCLRDGKCPVPRILRNRADRRIGTLLRYNPL